jgi:hypothetical protein
MGLKQPYWNVMEKLGVARLKVATMSRSMSRQDFITDIKSALEAGRGYAAAKIGVSQKSWMYYEIFLAEHRSPEEVATYETQLKFHCLKQEGLFPESPAFYLTFNRFYIEHVRNIDSLGITYRQALQELNIIRHYGLTNKLIYFTLQEADRSIPSNEANCYLPLFKDKKILLVCPFADFLRERASKETFERVWSKIGKPWFYPASVEALEFPYGFARDTHEQYATVLDLLKDIQENIQKRDFDVALVAAGGLSIPIVSFVKQLGKIGIDLGGALQFTFGVSGKRWQHWEDFKKTFFNEYWTHLPAKYRPKETDVCDNGAYW